MKNTLLVGLAVATTACGEAQPPRPGFVHVEGDLVIDAVGKPITLEGMTFGVFDGEPGWSEPRAAYAEVASMGMNHVRIFFDADDLEEESSPGSYDSEALASLDGAIARAKDSGLLVVLALNAPPGGAASNCKDAAFWDSADHQARMVELWRMLASRYAEEPAITGYALLDIPSPTATAEQWRVLAEETTRAIRAVDTNHALFIARAHAVACNYNHAAAKAFARLADGNVIYEFDRTQPWSYVAQLTTPAGANAPLDPFGPYPDETRVAVDQSKAIWLHTPQDTRPSASALNLTPTETDWTEKVFSYTVTDPGFTYAVPVLQADFTAGKAYFDSVLVEQIDEAGEAHVVLDLDIESNAGFGELWQGTADGMEVDGPGEVAIEASAKRGQASLSIHGTRTLANLPANDWIFVKVGDTFRVTSWVKGEALEARDLARVRLDFWGYKEPTAGFNRETLARLFSDYRAWGIAQGVPMLVSSFGTSRPTFEDDRGGLRWVGDMIDIMREQRLGWTYWGYRDPDFGIYTSERGERGPDTVNQPLVELLTEKRR